MLQTGATRFSENLSRESIGKNRDQSPPLPPQVYAFLRLTVRARPVFLTAAHSYSFPPAGSLLVSASRYGRSTPLSSTYSCQSVGRSVCRSVCPSVGRILASQSVVGLSVSPTVSLSVSWSLVFKPTAPLGDRSADPKCEKPGCGVLESTLIQLGPTIMQ